MIKFTPSHIDCQWEDIWQVVIDNTCWIKVIVNEQLSLNPTLRFWTPKSALKSTFKSTFYTTIEDRVLSKPVAHHHMYPFHWKFQKVQIHVGAALPPQYLLDCHTSLFCLHICLISYEFVKRPSYIWGLATVFFFSLWLQTLDLLISSLKNLDN